MKKKYLKENLEPVVFASKNLTEVLLNLKMTTKGNSRETIKKYIALYGISISHFESTRDRYERTLGNAVKIKKIPLKDILIKNSTYNTTSNLKERLYSEGLKERKCEKCGQDENWHGEHISLILDHINGVNNDNRLENLRIVCPNCNAALPTHCRGIKRTKKYQSSVDKINVHIQSSKLQRKVERPPYDILIKSVNDIGYTATSRIYNVSDNTIRKWIIFYRKFGI